VKIEKEIKSFPLEIKAITEESEYFVFEGYASTFNNVDYGDDVVVRGAFTDSLTKNSQVPILWAHKMDELPLGKSFQLYEDDKGLFVKANLPKVDPRMHSLIAQIKLGSIQEMSIGYFVEDYEMKKDGIRLLKKINLFEISLVNKAMNPQAKVTGFKSFETLRDIEQTLTDNGFSNKEAKTLISKIKEFSSKRDAGQDNQRDADTTKQKIITDLNNFINNLKK
jgi:HK97 family phage prohead protease